MAKRGGLANMGTVGLVVREQATLGAAIEALARFIHIQSDAMCLEIERRDGVITLGMLLRLGHQRAKRQSTEYAVGRLHAIIRSLSGGDWRPLEVHFMHSPPRDRRHHRYFFGCNVIFDSDRDAILCAASDMSRPIPTAEPLIASYLRSRVEAIDVRPKAWDEKVGELVRSLLSNGLCTIERVAECLACDRRTIHRHLLDCGTSYSAILDSQRTDLVLRLIEDGNRPLVGVAELLGFSAQSAMARWFRARFGCSISQWRNGIRPKALTMSSRGVASKSRSTGKTKRPPVGVRRSNRLGR